MAGGVDEPDVLHPLTIHRAEHLEDIPSRCAFPSPSTPPDQANKKIRRMAISLHLKVRLLSNHVSEGGQSLRSNCRRIGLRVRFNRAYDVTKQPIHGVCPQRLGPAGQWCWDEVNRVLWVLFCHAPDHCPDTRPWGNSAKEGEFEGEF